MEECEAEVNGVERLAEIGRTESMMTMGASDTHDHNSRSVENLSAEMTMTVFVTLSRMIHIAPPVVSQDESALLTDRTHNLMGPLNGSLLLMGLGNWNTEPSMDLLRSSSLID